MLDTHLKMSACACCQYYVDNCIRNLLKIENKMYLASG